MFHVAEKIFFHLDYDSYTNCLDVCKEWRSFLSSKSTFARAKREFGGKMWVSALKAKKLPRIKIAPRINIICWTTNGREVAYIEDEAVAGVTVLHFIDEEGELHSAKLKERIQHENGGSLREGNNLTVEGVLLSNRRCVRDLWILKKVILIDTYMSLTSTAEGNWESGKVYAVDKHSLEESTLFTNFTNRMTPTFFSKIGVQFLCMKRSDTKNVNVIWLRQVSMEHVKSRDQRFHDWETERDDDYVGDLDCCYSIKVHAAVDFIHKYVFSSDGTLVIIAEETRISAFAIGGSGEGSLLTNSKLLVLVGEAVDLTGVGVWSTWARTQYTFVDLENGMLVKSVNVGNHPSPLEHTIYYHEITKKHLLVFHVGCYDGWGEFTEGFLRLVDLKSFEEKRLLVRNLNFDNRPLGHWSTNPLARKSGIFKLNVGDLAVLLDDDGATLIDPTSVDEGEVANPLNKLTGNRAVLSPVKFQEVTNGLCVVTTETSALLWDDDSAHNSVSLGFQIMFLKGETLSAALQRWVELFSEPKLSIPAGGFFT